MVYNLITYFACFSQLYCFFLCRSVVKTQIIQSIPENIENSMNRLKKPRTNSERILLNELSEKRSILLSPPILDYYIALQVALVGTFTMSSILSSEMRKGEMEYLNLTWKEIIDHVSVIVSSSSIASIGLSIIVSLISSNKYDRTTIEGGLDLLRIIFWGNSTSISTVCESVARSMALHRLKKLTQQNIRTRELKSITVTDLVESCSVNMDASPSKIDARSDTVYLLHSIFNRPLEIEYSAEEETIIRAILDRFRRKLRSAEDNPYPSGAIVNERGLNSIFSNEETIDGRNYLRFESNFRSKSQSYTTLESSPFSSNVRFPTGEQLSPQVQKGEGADASRQEERKSASFPIDKYYRQEDDFLSGIVPYNLSGGSSQGSERFQGKFLEQGFIEDRKLSLDHLKESKDAYLSLIQQGTSNKRVGSPKMDSLPGLESNEAACSMFSYPSSDVVFGETPLQRKRSDEVVGKDVRIEQTLEIDSVYKLASPLTISGQQLLGNKLPNTRYKSTSEKEEIFDPSVEKYRSEDVDDQFNAKLGSSSSFENEIERLKLENAGKEAKIKNLERIISDEKAKSESLKGQVKDILVAFKTARENQQQVVEVALKQAEESWLMEKADLTVREMQRIEEMVLEHEQQLKMEKDSLLRQTSLKLSQLEERLRKEHEGDKLQLMKEVLSAMEAPKRPPSTDKFEKFRSYQKMGLSEEQIRRAMKIDKMTAEDIDRFFRPETTLPFVLDLSKYSLQSRKACSSGETFIIRNLNTDKLIRIEQRSKRFQSMAADMILFSSDENISEVRKKCEGQFPAGSTEIETYSFLSSLYALRLHPADSIDHYDSAFNTLKALNLHPFPDYIMHDLVTAERRRHRNALSDAKRYIVDSDFTIWKSPFGVPIEPFFKAPMDKVDIQVGIIDDFGSTTSSLSPSSVESSTSSSSPSSSATTISSSSSTLSSRSSASAVSETTKGTTTSVTTTSSSSTSSSSSSAVVPLPSFPFSFSPPPSLPYSHGAQCRDIIDSFELTTQNPKQERLDDLEKSNIIFTEYNFFGTIVDRENSGEIINFGGINRDKNFTLAEEAYNARISILLESLSSVVANNLQVLNVSMEWQSWFPEESFDSMLVPLRQIFRVIRDNNCICVFAAGNQSEDLESIHDKKVVDDCIYVERSLFVALAKEEEFRSNMVVVGASGIFGQYCSFSNWGRESVCFVAPGERVQLPKCDENLPLRPGSRIPERRKVEMTGTSAAAALVTALIAVMLQQFPQLRERPEDVIPRLVNTLDCIARLDDDDDRKCQFTGRINPSRALRKDAIGRFGVRLDQSLSSESLLAAKLFQEHIYKAESIERDSIRGTLRFRDLSFMGLGDFWGMMCSLLEDEMAEYQSALRQLKLIVFEEDSVLWNWQKFEAHRIEKLLDLKSLLKSEVLEFMNGYNISQYETICDIFAEDSDETAKGAVLKVSAFKEMQLQKYRDALREVKSIQNYFRKSPMHAIFQVVESELNNLSKDLKNNNKTFYGKWSRIY